MLLNLVKGGDFTETSAIFVFSPIYCFPAPGMISVGNPLDFFIYELTVSAAPSKLPCLGH
ncbi:MAG: hypothetical protein ACP5N0_11580 [Methanosarcina sp.]|uniref:hypothetical protein n=1 Tax=Methanosarcina sp. TaxID=2213 RepID=UPI003BB7E5CA